MKILYMTNALTSSAFVCGVKNDAIAFILPNFILAFWVTFFIWYFDCIVSSKSTPRYFTLSFLLSGVSKYLTVLLSRFFKCALFPKKITSVLLVLIVILLTSKPMINITQLALQTCTFNCLGQMHPLLIIVSINSLIDISYRDLTETIYFILQLFSQFHSLFLKSSYL